MPEKRSESTILVLNALPATKRREAAQMMGGVSIPVEALQANVTALLKQCRQMFEGARAVLEGATLAHVDLSLGISVDGSVGLLGTKAGAEASGGVTVRLEFNKSP